MKVHRHQFRNLRAERRNE